MSISITNKKNYGYAKELSRPIFNLILGLTIGYGFLMNFIITFFFSGFIMKNIPFVATLIGYFVLAFAGIFIMKKYENPVLSFLGYNMLVVPIGVMLAYVLPSYALSTILITCFITTICTICMMVAAMIFPNFFLKIGGPLCISLLLCIIVELILLLCGVNLGIMDWIVALIFCGYIGYDWAKINRYEIYTVDMAIDGAGELYLDIINLFLRILSIIGGKDND